MKILITGITGFVGGKLSAQLIEAGHEVIALVRETSNTSGIDEAVIIKETDLFDPDSLDESVKSSEATVAIHLASYFDFYPSDKDLMYRVNVEGTKNLMYACVDTNVERFIYCSTTETIGPVRFPPGNEDTELNPVFDYSKSKVLAEKVVREISDEMGISHIILRPTGIMGEGDFYTAFEIIQAINDKAIPVLPGDGSKHLMYTHIDDVVEGFMAAITSQSALNNTMILCVDAPMTYKDLIEFLGNALGVKPPSRRIPTSLAKLGIGLMSPFKNRGKTTFLWHMKSIQSMDEDRWYTNERAKRLLNWAPKYTMIQGLQKAIEWYYAEGHIEKRS